MILEGDNLVVLRTLPDASVHSVVVDPPYGLSAEPDVAEVLKCWLSGEDYEHGKSGFMGREWDSFVPGPVTWREVFRVLRPGGHALVHASTRTHGLMEISLRLAGFRIKDTIDWLFSNGSIPKGRALDKAIDALRCRQEETLRVVGWLQDRVLALGLTREDLNRAAGVEGMASHWLSSGAQPSIPSLEHWELLEPLVGPAPDWLRPLLLPSGARGAAWECRTAVGRRKGASSIMGNARPESFEWSLPATAQSARWAGWSTQLRSGHEPIILACREGGYREPVAETVLRWQTGGMNLEGCRTLRGALPMNVVLSHTPGCTASDCVEDCPVRHLDETSGILRSGVMGGEQRGWGKRGIFGAGGTTPAVCYADEGGASRFYPTFAFEEDDFFPFRYCAKASKSDRGEDNTWPTVKPSALVRWLVRLVTPPGGVVLDPYLGSGTTAVAALREGFDWIGIERDPGALEIARARIDREPVPSPAAAPPTPEAGLSAFLARMKFSD